MTLRTLSEWLEVRAEQTPDRVGYSFADGDAPGRALTYAELATRVAALGSVLQDRLSPDDRVVLIYPAGPDFLVAFLACMRAGVIAVPCPVPLRAAAKVRFEGVIDRCEPALVLGTERSVRTVARTSRPDVACLATDALPHAPVTAPRPPSRIALLQYTSGSVSSPRGTIITYENLEAGVGAIERIAGLGPDDVGVTWLPHFHDMGLVDGLLAPLRLGFSVHVLAPTAFLRRPLRWLEAIAHHRGTHSGAPNFAYDLCVRTSTAAERATLDLSSWANAYVGAEPVRPSTLAAFAEAFGPSGLPARALGPCYGLAEATLFVCGGRVADAEPIRVDAEALAQDVIVAATDDGRRAIELVDLGEPTPQLAVRIVDPSRCVAVPAGRVGEIWIAGAAVAEGYWGDTEATEATFGGTLRGDDRRWLRTSDLGFVDARGHLVFTGRLDDVMVRRGRKHYPSDVEATVEAMHPAIRPGCCAAFAADDDQRIALTLEIDPGTNGSAPPEPAAIASHVLSQHDLVVDAIAVLRRNTSPRTTSGKIKRRACRDLLRDPAASGQTSAVVRRWTNPAPRVDAPAVWTAADLEDRIAAWVSVRLGQAPASIDRDARFSALGIDSLGLAELCGRIEAEHPGLKVHEAAPYDHPTVRALAAHLSAASPDDLREDADEGPPAAAVAIELPDFRRS